MCRQIHLSVLVPDVVSVLRVGTLAVSSPDVTGLPGGLPNLHRVEDEVEVGRGRRPVQDAKSELGALSSV